MVALDEAGDVVRPALLWNDTRSAGAAADLVAELGGAQALGGRGRARAGGQLHRHQAAVARRARAASGRPGAPRAAAARLADLAARRRGRREPVTDRGDASGTGYWSPATGELPPDLLELGLRARRGGPAGARPARGGRRDRRTASLVGAGHRRQHGRRARPRRSAPGDVVVSIGTAAPSSRPECADRATRAAWWPASPTPPGGFLPLVVHAQRRPGPRRRRRRCWASTTPRSTDSRCAAPPGAGGLVAAALPRRASAPRTCPTPPGACRADPGNLTREQPGPRRGRGHAVRPRRRRRRAARPGRRGSAGVPDRRRRPLARRSGGRARCSACRSRAPRRASTSRSAPPARPRGPSPAHPAAARVAGAGRGPAARRRGARPDGAAALRRDRPICSRRRVAAENGSAGAAEKTPAVMSRASGLLRLPGESAPAGRADRKGYAS